MRELRRIAVLAAAVALLAVLMPANGTAAADDRTDGRWRRLVTVGEGPSERSAPVAAGLDGRLYVFGGGRDDFTSGVSTFFNDLHRLDVDRNRWTRLAPVGQLPPARAFAAGAADTMSRRVFVFGGSTFEPSQLARHPFVSQLQTPSHPRPTGSSKPNDAQVAPPRSSPSHSSLGSRS